MAWKIWVGSTESSAHFGYNQFQRVCDHVRARHFLKLKKSLIKMKLVLFNKACRKNDNIHSFVSFWKRTKLFGRPNIIAQKVITSCDIESMNVSLVSTEIEIKSENHFLLPEYQKKSEFFPITIE